jgi:hypothetical protein
MGDFRMPELKMPYIPSPSERYQEDVIEKLRAIERGLPAEHELQISAYVGGENIRVQRLQFTDSAVVVVHGIDESENAAYIMSTSFALELICKVVKTKPKTRRSTIGFDVPPKTSHE